MSLRKPGFMSINRMKFKAAILSLGQLLLIPTIYLVYTNPPTTVWLFFTLLLSYKFGVFGWVLGQHRYFTHKQFKVSPFMEKCLMFWAVMGTWQSPMEWVWSHNHHHKHSDTEKDVHSPKYLGWKNWFFFFHKIDTMEPNISIVRMSKSHWHQFFLNFKYGIIFGYAFICYYLFGIMGLTYGWLVPTSYAMLSQIVIVMNHKNGEPKNSFLIDLFTLGEGRHKDHHNNPKDYSKDKFIKPVINLIRVV